ncbi:SPT3 Dosage dependent suppressor of Ty-induced promoter mutations-like protein, partial [Lecanicillium sp. MT-2017a]
MGRFSRHHRDNPTSEERRNTPSEQILSPSLDLRAEIDSDQFGLGPALCAAIKYAGIATVRVLVKHGANVNHPYGLTPLGEAVDRYRDDPEILYMLLRQGADANGVGSLGCTPLYVAAQGANVPPSLVQLLLDNGADPNAIGDTETMATPLHAACDAGDFEVAKLLLGRGADPNAVTRSGVVPLHFAAEGGYLPIALELLERGADPNASEVTGWQPLTLSIERKQVKMTETLLFHGACPLQQGALRSPLSLAIRSSVLDIVEAVIAFGADVSEMDDSDLEASLEHSEPEIAELLLGKLAGRQYRQVSEQAGCYARVVGGDYVLMVSDYLDEVNQALAFDVANYSILHLAAFHGRNDFVATLLEKGARPDGEGGLTPLQVAAWAGHATVAQYLIQQGASVGKKTTSGLSALGGAAIEGHTEVVRLLLNCGASLNSRDKYGDTPLHIAVKFGSIGALKVLLEYGADVQSKNTLGQTAVALSWNRPHAIDVFKLAPNVDLTARNGRGETLLFLAASAGRADAIDALFDDDLVENDEESDWFQPRGGIRLLGNVADHDGNLPIFAAVEAGNWEAIWRLLVVDDDIFRKRSGDGKTLMA